MTAAGADDGSERELGPGGLVIEAYREDEALCEATRSDGQGRCRVYRSPRTQVVLGRGSKPERELELEACLADRVPVARRRGGGCAVVIDPGDLVVSVALPLRGIGENLRHFARLSTWLAAALARLGIPGVRREGHSDLVRGDRKVGGACIHRTRDLLYYSTTLLCVPAVGLMERYLQHPPREPEYRRGRGHADFVGSLLEEPSLEGAVRLEAALAEELDLAKLQD